MIYLEFIQKYTVWDFIIIIGIIIFIIKKNYVAKKSKVNIPENNFYPSSFEPPYEKETKPKEYNITFSINFSSSE